MKAEEFQAKLDNFRTKAGNYPKNRNFENLMTLLKYGKVRYAYYTGSGRWTRISFASPTNYLIPLGLNYKEGNDAPRGGQIGNFITLFDDAEKMVADWRIKEFEKELEAKRKADEEKRQRVLEAEAKQEAIKQEAATIKIDEEFKTAIMNAYNYAGDLKAGLCVSAFKALLARNEKEKVNTQFWQVMRITISRTKFPG